MGICCQNDVKRYKFLLKDTKEEKCNIILSYEDEILTQSNEDIILADVQKKDWIEELLDLINQKLFKINNLSENTLLKTKRIFDNILNNFLVKDEKFFYLKDFNNIHKINDLQTINIFVKLFVLIHNRKEKISHKSISFFIESIATLLKEDKILDEIDLYFLKSKLNEIYSKENEIEEENFNNVVNSNSISFIDNINVGTEIGNREFANFSFYSKNSQTQIKKMGEEIKYLKSYIKKSNLDDKKQYMEVKFLDEKIKEEFPINIYLSGDDKFGSLINEFYERYPEFEEKGIKKFLINGKSIKRSELIENIGLNNSTKILIEY